MRDSSQNKARTKRIVRVWCDHCKAEVKITTPQEHEAKYCPVCRRKTLTETIRYC